MPVKTTLKSRILDKKDREIAQIFDGLSRSKASLQLMQIRAKGLVSESDLGELTDEFLNQTKPL